MNTTRSFLSYRHVCTLFVAAAGLGLAGCESVESALARETPREEVVGSLTATSGEVAEVNGRIDDAFRQLNDLLNHPAPDLQRQYGAYTTSVDKLEASAERLRTLSEELQRKGREYLIEWDREIATIRNDDLRESTVDRKNEVAEQFDTLQNRYAQVRDRLAPLVRRLNDMESALQVDLTAAGVANARSSLQDARSTADPVQNSLNEFTAALRNATDALAARGRGAPNASR